MSILNETNVVIDTLQYVKKFTGKTLLIKLGGSILHDQSLIQLLCDDLALLRAAGIRIIIVHGGSKAINHALDAYQISTSMLNGLRVTSKEAMDVIEMVLCGQINQVLVRGMNRRGVQAAGLSGADHGMLLCQPYGEEYGCVGEIQKINSILLQQYLESQNTAFGTIPIIAPIGVDEQGNALNINADWVASCIASALGIQKLIYLTDQNGIKDETGEIISEVSADQLHVMIKNNVVRDGMLTKANTILNALDSGITNIHIINGSTPHALLIELFTTHGVGTVCHKLREATQ